jgi:tRNA modification GTPase
MTASMPNRVSVLTPAGRGAIAVVAASGPRALAAIDAAFRAANGRGIAEQQKDRILFGHWTVGSHREEVVVLRGNGDAVEIHCHGGAAAVARVVEALTANGCEQFNWTEWLEAASADPIALEADVALAKATTGRTAALLLEQRHGALRHAIQQVRGALERGEVAAADQRLSALRERSAFGLHLTEPWQVAIAGRPNVGKSSLINALVGYPRAIVFDQPGTTRDVLSADAAIDGWPVRLTDAAGIRATDDPLESEGVARACDQVRRADLLLWVLDATMLADPSAAVDQARRELAEAAPGACCDANLLTIVNKVDLCPRGTYNNSEAVIYVSALTRCGLKELLAQVSQRLVPDSPAHGEAVPFTSRQAELLQRSRSALRSGDLRAALATLNGLESRGLAR